MLDIQQDRDRAVESSRCCKAAKLMIVAALLSASLAGRSFAQPIQNIAGNYRGLITRCLSAAHPNDCRRDLAIIVRLADEADAKRAGWVQARTGADNALAQRLDGEYTLALHELNQVIQDFNKKAGF